MIPQTVSTCADKENFTAFTSESFVHSYKLHSRSLITQAGHSLLVITVNTDYSYAVGVWFRGGDERLSTETLSSQQSV
ncbi:hypothetical protein Tco_0978427 [Tanacetum coccineum]|uniref:Uncharacterized protein n=1 Tax=Tanacetum coccineum TaxID=301880 RepID=A0ABQ5EN20_9ASTR